MKCSVNTHIHGYLESAFDASVRVALADGRVAVFTLTDEGVVGRIAADGLTLPPALTEIMDMPRLLGFLRNYPLNITGNQVMAYGVPQTVGYPADIKTSPPVPTSFF
ncbi:hypothetical protein [uncultured Thiothrix sp.]|uniref:hypothetical protein n=1 Tax=uncultured Thiothrix sp. TaxID=223185 RepID=UPI0026302121|nr:hypothetical protein [uncultured Thiothrix sp.]HRJ94742.1 hypothetical protein [Candidatus Thiothrix moscowensis]